MMTKALPFGIAAVLWFLSLRPAQAVAPTPAELAEAKRWSAARFDGAERFFSFTCGGKPSAELLGGWELKRSTRELDPPRVEHTLTYSDPGTGLVVRCVRIEYRDFPATEWVLFVKNIFRQDGGNLWPEDTDPNRAGMSQIQYIQGFYAFWDGLLQRHPHLLIDNCAEGARKIDLETIRRSIVLWRSDCQAPMNFDPVVNQGFNYGLLQWIPLCGAVTPLNKLSAYSFRSAYCPALLMGWPMAGVPDVKDRWSKVDVDLLRKLLNEYLAIRPYLFGDFYPLMPYSLDQDTWIAWQFDVPEQGQGMVQAFRRGQSNYEIARFKLRGLHAGAQYVLTNLDTGESQTLAGRELLDKGLAVPIAEQPGSAVIVYKKLK
jgi:alpha-galactosidase